MLNDQNICFKQSKQSCYVIDELLQNVDLLTERNALFAHPGNVVLEMTVDEREHIRELGYRKMLKARQTVPTRTVRNVVTSKINFMASDYIESINGNPCVVYPPQMLRKLNVDDVKLFMDSLLTLRS